MSGSRRRTAVGYYRVLTDEEAGIAKTAIERYAERNGYRLLAVYSDPYDGRPAILLQGFGSVLAALEEGETRTVIAYSLATLAPSPRLLADVLRRLFDATEDAELIIIKYPIRIRGEELLSAATYMEMATELVREQRRIIARTARATAEERVKEEPGIEPPIPFDLVEAMMAYETSLEKIYEALVRLGLLRWRRRQRPLPFSVFKQRVEEYLKQRAGEIIP